jgi:hypothetical protein
VVDKPNHSTCFAYETEPPLHRPLHTFHFNSSQHTAWPPSQLLYKPIRLVVVLSTPSVIGRCNVLTLDRYNHTYSYLHPTVHHHRAPFNHPKSHHSTLSGASSGSGEREWISYEMTVDSLSGDSDMASLRQFLVQNYRLSPPTHIPVNLFDGQRDLHLLSDSDQHPQWKCLGCSKDAIVVDWIISSVTILGPDTVSLLYIPLYPSIPSPATSLCQSMEPDQSALALRPAQ